MTKLQKMVVVGKTLYALKAETQLHSYDVGVGKWTYLGLLSPGPSNILCAHCGHYYSSVSSACGFCTSYTPLSKKCGSNYSHVKASSFSNTNPVSTFVAKEWTLVVANLNNKYGLVAIGISSIYTSNELAFLEYTSPMQQAVVQKFQDPIISITAVHGMAKPKNGILLVGSEGELIKIQEICPAATGGVVSWKQHPLAPATRFAPKQREWMASFLCGSNLVMVGDARKGFVFNIDHRIWTNFALEVPTQVPTCGECFQFDGCLFMLSDSVENDDEDTNNTRIFELDVDEGRWTGGQVYTDGLGSSENPRMYKGVLEKLHERLGTGGSGASPSTRCTVSPIPRFSLCQYVIDKFLSRTGADIFFLVESQKVPVHKYFVTKRCPYFGALIGEMWVQQSTAPIVLAEFTFDSFFVFLEYQYTGWIGPGVVTRVPSFSIDLAKKCLEDADRICFQEYALCCVEWAARHLTRSQFSDYFCLLRPLKDHDNPSRNEYVQKFWEVSTGKFHEEECVKADTVSSNEHFKDYLKLVQSPATPDIIFMVEDTKIGADKIICSRFPRLAGRILGQEKLEIDVPNFVWAVILKYIYSDKFCIPREMHTLTGEWCNVMWSDELSCLGAHPFALDGETEKGWKDATEFWGQMLCGANLAGIPVVKVAASFVLSWRANLLSWDKDAEEICRMLAYADKGKSFELWQNAINFVHADRKRIESKHVADLKSQHPFTAFRVMESGWTLEGPYKRFKYDQWYRGECK